jgi:uncharacterized protein with ParB-like and HNH nuclease domain/predicted transport protein
MKATEASLLSFLKSSPQLTIPIYQRTYSWTKRECGQLWDDVLRAGRSASTAAHFIGSVVYIESGLYQVKAPVPLMVIDGQQRLTTVSLLLEALARRLGDTEPAEGFSARKIRNRYLLDPEEDGDLGYKLLLTQTDKETMFALMRQKPLPGEPSLRVKENFEFFEEKVGSLAEPDPRRLCEGLAKLIIVDISLDKLHDNPQLIFESMNSTGLDLSQADMIRNFVLMDLEPRRQAELYRDHWRPMELAFGQEAYRAEFDAFMRHYLTLKTGDIPNLRAVYDAFKAYYARSDINAAGIAALLADLHAFAGYYCAMALGKEPDKALASAFRDLREIKVDVAYPFLLSLYHDYKQDDLPAGDLARIVRTIESYVFRRAVCGIPTNSMNKTFLALTRAVRSGDHLESTQAHLLLLESYRRFPRDEEFKRELASRDLYNFPRRTYWLRKLENHGRKETVQVGEYTIEHIMPQNPNLSAAWQGDLGPGWKAVQERWLHTLGNLTLTGYNPEYSDRPFADKRDMKGGFRHSPLNLNAGLADEGPWDEAAIRRRAERLAGLAVQVWALPALPGEMLAVYKPAARKPGMYTLDSHPYLAAGQPMRPLFEVLRKEILNLDPNVTEEVLKLYIAYKAETNFVDVVPQAKRLRLSLNMPFHELDDPEGIAKDVTNVGRWGNGDVEVGLSYDADLPYAMGLIRQAFERQMRVLDADG